jgi:hypothetical protein
MPERFRLAWNSRFNHASISLPGGRPLFHRDTRIARPEPLVAGP